MSIKVAIVATIDAEADHTIDGRTLLQKKLYFLSVLTNQDFGYRPYFYGPYSSIVSAEVGALQSAGFIEERTQTLGGVDEFGDVRKYTYALLEGAELFLTRQPDFAARYQSALKRINIGQVPQSQKLLSMAAKVHLILASHVEAATVKEIQEEAKALRWTLSDGDIVAVEKYLEAIGLLEFKTASA